MKNVFYMVLHFLGNIKRILMFISLFEIINKFILFKYNKFSECYLLFFYLCSVLISLCNITICTISISMFGDYLKEKHESIRVSEISKKFVV